MSRLFVSIIVLVFISGCVTNAQTPHPTKIKSPGSAYTAMTVEGTNIFYRDLAKPLPSKYRSAARTAPLHHPERSDRFEQESKTSHNTTITSNEFPPRSLITRPPKTTRLYLKDETNNPSRNQAGRRS